MQTLNSEEKKLAEFACKVCRSKFTEKNPQAVGCAWRFLDNEYCPHVIDALRQTVEADNKTTSQTLVFIVDEPVRSGYDHELHTQQRFDKIRCEAYRKHELERKRVKKMRQDMEEAQLRNLHLQNEIMGFQLEECHKLQKLEQYYNSIGYSAEDAF